jgi:hypothetical protein
MAMPKGWKMPEQVRTVLGDTPKVVISMPTSTSLSRPMLTPSYLKVYNYPIMKIKILVSEARKYSTKMIFDCFEISFPEKW